MVVVTGFGGGVVVVMTGVGADEDVGEDEAVGELDVGDGLAGEELELDAAGEPACAAALAVTKTDHLPQVSVTLLPCTCPAAVSPTK